MTKHKVRLRFGRVHSSRDEDKVTIEMEDVNSSIQFLDVELSLEEWGDLVSGRGSREVEVTLRGLESIGKKYEHEKRSVKVPVDALKDVGYKDRQKVLGNWLLENAKEEGWQISTYLGSQNSIGYAKDGFIDVNYSVYRYV